MVINLQNIIAFFRLIRFQNLVIVAITQIFLRYFIILPLLGILNFESQINDRNFLFIVLATVFITAGGYVINDYFDRKTDLINRPGKVIVGRLITRRAAMIWHIFLNVMGVFFGIWASHNLGLLKVSVVFILVSGLLWFYSTTYKKQLLVGNLVVAFMIALVPLLLLLFEIPLLSKHYSKTYLIASSNKFDFLVAWIIAYAAFAFLLTFIREIVKDIEDFEGDAAFGCQSIPIRWGVPVAKNILYFLLAVTIIPIIFVLIFFLPDIISIVYITVLVILPLIFFGIMLFRAKAVSEFRRLSVLLKGVMLTGLLYCPVAYLIIKSLV